MADPSKATVALIETIDAATQHLNNALRVARDQLRSPKRTEQVRKLLDDAEDLYRDLTEHAGEPTTTNRDRQR